MGYQYLVAITKGEDKYLFVDGRNDSLLFVGSRSEFLDHADWQSYVGTKEFDYADEHGSTDGRMFWDNSTYISFDGHGVTRRTLAEFSNHLTYNCRYSHISPELYVRQSSVSGLVGYVDFCVGAELQGISQPEVDDFLISLDDSFYAIRQLPFTHCAVEGHKLFRAAQFFAAAKSESYTHRELLGWALAFRIILPQDGRNVEDIVDSKPSIAKRLYAALMGADWEDAIRLSLVIKKTDSYGYEKIMDIATAHPPLSNIIDLIEAGHTKTSHLTAILENSIDVETARAMAS